MHSSIFLQGVVPISKHRDNFTFFYPNAVASVILITMAIKAYAISNTWKFIAQRSAISREVDKLLI
jgi:hypothetical protein